MLKREEENLLDFIHTEHKKGYTKKEIREALIANDFSPKDIDPSLNKVFKRKRRHHTQKLLVPLTLLLFVLIAGWWLYTHHASSSDTQNTLGSTLATPEGNNPSSSPASFTQSSEGITLPPDTTNGIHLGQAFDSRIGGPTDPTHTLADEIGLIDFVWGASGPAPKGVYTTFYDPLQENPDPTSGLVSVNDTHTLSWFKANHPDWIEYTCAASSYPNQASVPDSDIAWEFGEAKDGGQWTPIDISNPAVLPYLVNTYFEPAIKDGFEGIAVDNVNLSNEWKRCGHFASNNGGWVQQYSGAPYDPEYISNIVSYIEALYPAIHAIGGSVTMNFSYDFELPIQYDQDLKIIAKNLDIAMPEGDVISIGKGTGDSSVADWLTIMNFEQYEQSIGKGLFLLDYYVYSSRLSYTNTNPRDTLQWALSNYLLIKGNHTYFSLVDEYTAPNSPPSVIETNNPRSTLAWLHPEYFTSIGSPIDTMYKSQGVYMRDYSNGLAIVNPDPDNSYTITVPANTYEDLYGNIVGPNIVISRQSGIVLLDNKT